MPKTVGDINKWFEKQLEQISLYDLLLNLTQERYGFIMPKSVNKTRTINLTAEECSEVSIWLQDQLNELEFEEEYIEGEGILLNSGIKKLIECLR